MEKDDDLRFVCKLCDKRYQCGKSLGGHMRSHIIANSAESHGKVEEAKMKKVASSSFNDEMNSNSKREKRFELDGDSGYGLREKPKKTWRIVNSKIPLPIDKVCKKCGKGFQSVKALCGHMACHSDKDRVLKDDYSWTSENEKQVINRESDTESIDPNPRKRSKNRRYKRVVVKSSIDLVNGSSSVSEIDEQEQEGVAMCLMMLSRDSGNWGGVISVVESSDNNSVVLETKSSSIDMRIGRNEGLKSVHKNGEDNLEMKKLGGKKLKSSVLDADIAQFENSDSGYFINGPKKVESDILVHGVIRKSEYNNQKVAKFEESGVKGNDDTSIVKWSMKYDSRKRTKDCSYSPESSKGKACKNAQKRSKYECLTCKKTFNTFQGLGGHRPCRLRNNVCVESRYESCENLVKDGDISPDFIPNGKSEESFSYKKPIAKEMSYNAKKISTSKKSKGHECPICLGIFKNGQDLVGHKRCHFIGGLEDSKNQSAAIKQDLPHLLDLNHPAPVEAEADGDVVFMPW